MTTTSEEIRLIVLLLLISLAVALAARWARLPYTLGLVVVGIGIGLFHLLPGIALTPDLVLLIFLPPLLFEGAWNLEQRELLRNWLPIFLLAGPGLGISVAIVGLILHVAVGLEWSVAFLLGAIISPTDPIAVLALLRQIGLSTRLRILIEGESLFNDGVAAAVTQTLLLVVLSSATASANLVSIGGASNGSTPSLPALSGPAFAEVFSVDLLRLVGGGIGLGLLIGLIVSRLVRHVNDHLIETTITVVVAYGVYLVGDLAQVSGILAVITAGLVLGSYGRKTGMSAATQEAVDGFWEFAAYIANSLLFLLMGLEIGQHPNTQGIVPVIWAVLSVVAGRALMIYLFIPLYNFLASCLQGKKAAAYIAPGPIPRRWRLVLLSAGLRGALSLALALALPVSTPQRDMLIIIVYGVVLVTLLGQGFGLRFLLPLFRRESRTIPPEPGEEPLGEQS
ncbi:MAG TPA: sodium:proton antiporter [Ktedonobacterales bacterium]|nr:sodium:proton antiporter [Ktedonobacterales bacterium]